MPDDKIFGRFPNPAADSLSSLSHQLYRSQQHAWSMLRDGVAALDAVRIRTMDFGKYKIRLQFNPKRIVSSGAKVDAASIKARKCFLCVDNLPPEQQGILYRDSFLVLCNPMPIFHEHFTISHINHIPQSIKENILSFLDLAHDVSKSHSVFYNGPKCGASAPDHMHFQVSPKNSIPVETDVITMERRVVKTIGEATLSLISGYGRETIVLEGSKKIDLEEGFQRLYAAMGTVMNTAEEPMMNAICSFSEGVWRMIVFPRAKHRPGVYFKEGEEKVVISPAAVDIGGLIVTPMEKDFTSVNETLIKQIFSEVSVTHSTAEQICTIT